MIDLSGLTWPVVLAFDNLILSSAIVITAFSLLGYMLTRTVHSPVAQSFSVLLACVLVVSAGDVIIPRVQSSHAAIVWLRVQWLGIAMVPAAYLHFSDTLLRTTREFSAGRRLVVGASYIFSFILVLMAFFTDVLVYDGTFAPPVSHLSAGPLFLFFVLYFALTAAYGAFNVVLARQRCLTPASRRRMTYLALSFVAPGLAVFPYLISYSLSQHIPPTLALLLSMVANIVVGLMLVIMAYSVLYYSVLMPDRVIRHDLIHYLLRGPVVGIAVIVVMLVIPRVELILGLSRDTALVFAVVGVIVLGQLAVNAAKPWIDRLIYRQDREEIAWIQTLDRRLLTSSDLRQFLTNVLIGLCELLRVDTGFVAVQTAEGPRIEASLGDLEAAMAFAQSPEGQRAWQPFAPKANGHTDVSSEAEPRFSAGGRFWYCPLTSQDGERRLGLLAVRARSAEVVMDAAERLEANGLLSHASSAIADRYVQEGIFATLQSLLPDLERIQGWRGAVRYAEPSAEEASSPEEMMTLNGPWLQWVKDALSHYWGGPKLTDSPLMELKVVQGVVDDQDGNLTRALRAVLQEAIERQRPAGERKLTAADWLLYNILDFRFVQGQRVRDIARRLSMSESDLYRKQRAAVAEVARTLAEMEATAEAKEKGTEV